MDAAHGHCASTDEGTTIAKAHGRDPGIPRRTRSSERTFPQPVSEGAWLARDVSRQLTGLMGDLARDCMAPRTLSIRLRAAELKPINPAALQDAVRKALSLGD